MGTPPIDVVDRGRVTVVEVPTDECDACPADAHVQAFVYVKLNAGTIAMCGHHATEHWDELTRQAIKVIDLRHLLRP